MKKSSEYFEGIVLNLRRGILKSNALPMLVEVSSFDEDGLADTSRGNGGHGSSGGHASL